MRLTGVSFVIAVNGQSPSGHRRLCPLALPYSLYFLITKHGSGAVCAQFANSQTNTV